MSLSRAFRDPQRRHRCISRLQPSWFPDEALKQAQIIRDGALSREDTFGTMSQEFAQSDAVADIRWQSTVVIQRRTCADGKQNKRRYGQQFTDERYCELNNARREMIVDRRLSPKSLPKCLTKQALDVLQQVLALYIARQQRDDSHNEGQSALTP